MRYYTLVLVPGHLDEDDICFAISDLLDPYFRDLQCEAFQVPCECTRTTYESAEVANKQAGDFRAAWRTYQALPENDRPMWRHYIARWETAAAAAAPTLKSYCSPNPECVRCNGTGLMMTTRASRIPGYKFDYYLDPTDMEDELDETWIWPVAKLPGGVTDLEIEAIVTPDGQWYASRSRNNDAAWQQTAQQLFETHRNCQAVKCVLHL